ncbi:DUF7544 domain-containing protein [Halospeciosus flavus]|uniref:Glycerophosphoryl diester phosphodiesterase membrane domain-containing protein n=1 Tax=Halospeciosus flavus TaxID=3032283 RepID=A0ABD5Z3C8_9EURY|nr:hypothetical protein [Halospeciosus flavus]
MSWYAVDALEGAFDESKSLLQPFEAGVWLRLAVVVLFTGGSSVGRSPTMVVDNVPLGALDPSIVPLRLGVLLALGTAFVVLFGVVGAVFEFVFVDGLRMGEVRLAAPFGRSLGAGVRLFGFRLCLGLAVALPLAAVAGVALTTLQQRALVPLFWLVFLLPVLGLLLLAALVVSAFTTGFVVPLMADRDIGVLDGWRTFWPALTDQWREFAVYALVRLALSVVAALAASIVAGAFLAPIALLAGVSLFGPGVGTAGLVVALAIGVVLALVVLIAVRVPIGVYMRYHSLLVLDAAPVDFDLEKRVS